MNRIFPALVFVMLLLVGCAHRATKTTEVHRPDLQASAYNDYVTRRTQELRQMGGPFQDELAARTKAEEQAHDLYGEPPAEYRTTWTWGDDGNNSQREVKETLEKMDRDAKRS